MRELHEHRSPETTTSLISLQALSPSRLLRKTPGSKHMCKIFSSVAVYKVGPQAGGYKSVSTDPSVWHLDEYFLFPHLAIETKKAKDNTQDDRKTGTWRQGLLGSPRKSKRSPRTHRSTNKAPDFVPCISLHSKPMRT